MDTKRSDVIRYEQTKLLYNAMTTSVWGTALGIFFLVMILRPVIDHTVLTIWAVFFGLLTSTRAVHAYVFWRVTPSPAEIPKWTRQFAAGSLVAAFCWGSAGLWLFPVDHAVSQVMVAFVLTITCAVAITTLSPLRYLIFAYIIIALLPLAVHFLLIGTATGRLMGIMLSILIFLLMASAQHIYRTTLANISLRLDALDREEELRDSRQRLALHLQRTPLAVIEWNTDFEVTDWNNSAETIFGYTREEALGKHGLELIVPENTREYGNNVWRQLLANTGGLRSTNENITKDGRIILCEWYNTPLIDDSGRVIGIASLTQDVTERIRVEQLKNEFVSVVSHELRTPLTSIRGSLGLIVGHAVGEVPDKVKQLLEIANNNTERLLLIINDILDIDKIESGKLEYRLQPIQIMPLIEQAIVANNGYALQYDVHLKISQRVDDAFILADSDRIMQVLGNLVSNAVKFSPKGGRVELSVVRRDHCVRVSVTDHGPGIPEDFCSKLFDKFTQADTSNTRGSGGTGLGLSIAKGIVEHHNGGIDFMTEQGRGTTFYFELPEVTRDKQARMTS